MPSSSEAKAKRPKVWIWPAFRARPRLLASVLVGIAVYLVSRWLLPLPGSAHVLLGWNVGALLYVFLAWLLMRDGTPQVMQARALSQDEGRFTILAMVVLASAAVLLAVGSQLGQVKDLQGADKTVHLVLAAITVFTSWLFTQLLFAQHYAHDYYMARHRNEPDPLHFPGTRDPDYADFFYFACVIGASGQTADVAFQGRALRPVGTLHCTLAFFFNATLIALSINVAGSLL